MARLGDKYIAGFLDADGCIRTQITPTNRCVTLGIEFSQEASQDEVLYRIREEVGGSLSTKIVKSAPYTLLSMKRQETISLLHRIRQHLVVKRHFAEVVLDLADRRVERSEVPAMYEYLKVHRHMRSTPLPVHPSRSWTAGYLDGDGCFSVTRLSKLTGSASIILHVAADVRNTEGLELLHKAYGGNIHPMRGDRCRQWIVPLPPSKVLSMLGDIAKRMVVKADQVYFLLGCAKMGHFHDGSSIKAGLKHLKAQPHRLNEPRVDLQGLLATVQDASRQKRSDYGQFYRHPNGQIAGKSAQATVGPQ